MNEQRIIVGVLFILVFYFVMFRNMNKCHKCGSKNIVVWSADKAYCQDCGARN